MAMLGHLVLLISLIELEPQVSSNKTLFQIKITSTGKINTGKSRSKNATGRRSFSLTSKKDNFLQN